MYHSFDDARNGVEMNFDRSSRGTRGFLASYISGFVWLLTSACVLSQVAPASQTLSEM